MSPSLWVTVEKFSQQAVWLVLFAILAPILGPRPYGLFAIVLGLLAWLYLGALTMVICAEFNAVRAGRLWPRSLLSPFVDNIQLTPADERAYTAYAKTERHKPFENIDVSFGEPTPPGAAEPDP